MKRKIQFEPVSSMHVNAATDLVMAAYAEEREAVPFLPPGDDFTDVIHRSLSRLFDIGTGLVAIAEGELVGFLSGVEIDEFWGKVKGFYSPLFGHGAIKEHRSMIYQQMYRTMADELVKQECLSHAVTFFAHDEEAINTWFWLGFGHRCVDSIRKVEPISVTNQPDVVIQKMTGEGISDIVDLDIKLTAHHTQTPMFMPRMKGDTEQELRDWFKEDKHHLWVAYLNEKPVGYMKLEPTAETFVSRHDDVMNVKAGYVLPEARGGDIATMLLDTIQNWLFEHDYPLCGVDFEAFNITGSSFWNRHFTPYTYSLTRRIDERILDMKR